LAGGTDIYPAHVDRPLPGPVLDISALDELRGIEELPDGGWRIGALATWREICDVPLPGAFAALQMAGRQIGSIQVQNRATIGGNLCNASPAADGVPPLMVLDANIEIVSGSGARTMALDGFITGNRQTRLAAGELVSAIIIPESALSGVSTFAKLGARDYLVISIASVAVRLACSSDGEISEVAISVGACSPAPLRLGGLEKALAGAGRDNFSAAITGQALSGLAPIDDVRASAAYRSEAAAEMIRRAVAACLDEVGHA
ncbi:MAG TPA: xanthine dehydrogenase family protein subunit M, partial [Rhizobiales bacterium]|nr:xanthine dehydrogenase family protein subunit M [Hyphomicrobiales bacterium]